MTARKSTSRSRPSRTKNEVESELQSIQDEASSRSAIDSKTQTLASEHRAAVKAQVEGLSVDDVVNQTTQLNLTLSKSLSDVTEKLKTKVAELDAVNEAVKFGEEELERLHKIDIIKTSIELLLQEHADTKERLEKEAAKQREEWKEETEEHERRMAQETSDLALQRKRESDQYEYNKRVERAKKDDEFNLQATLRDRALADKIQASEKSLADRIALITKEEQDIAALKARVAGIEEETKKEVEKAVAIATNSLKRDLTHAFEIQKKDLQNENSILVQKNLAADAASKTLAEQNIKLQAQVDAANVRSAEVAKEALQSASGQTALTRVMEMAEKNGGSLPQRKS